MPRGLAEFLPPPRPGPVYVSDAVVRGRPAGTQIPVQTGGTAMTLTVDNPFERFRIGARPRLLPARRGAAGQPGPATARAT